MSETTQPRTPLSSFQRTVIALLTLLVAAVVAVAITFAVVTHNSDVERKQEACKALGVGSFDYYFCVEQAKQ